MQNIFIELLPPWIETGLQPAFYDKESGTVLQQTSRMYAKVNELVGSVNNQNSTIAEYIGKFNELHEYVYDYFDNLNVQTEINNKLNNMMLDGSLSTIISDYVNQYVDPKIDNQNKRITLIEDQVTGLGNFAPIPVSSISSMTDHTKVYVLTTDGNWYYWNTVSSEWTAGGTYQSTAIGLGSVEFDNLSSSLSQNIYGFSRDARNLGAIQQNNNANSFNVSQPIFIKAGTTITVSEDFVANYEWCLGKLTDDGLFFASSYWFNYTTDTSYTTTEDIFCVFRWRPLDQDWNTTDYTVNRRHNLDNNDITSILYFYPKNVENQLIDLDINLLYGTVSRCVCEAGVRFVGSNTRVASSTIYKSKYDIVVDIKNTDYDFGIITWSGVDDNRTRLSDSGWINTQYIIPANTYFTIAYRKHNNANVSDWDEDPRHLVTMFSYASLNYVRGYVDSYESGVSTYNYDGINLDLQYKHGYEKTDLYNTQLVTTSSQGFDIYGDYLVQLYNGGIMQILQYSTGAELGSISGIGFQHGDTCQFSNTFYDENDLLPLLYVTSDTTPSIVYIVRIQNVTTANIIKSYKLDNGAGYYAGHCFDFANNLLYCFGYKQNEFHTNTGGTNNTIISVYDMSQETLISGTEYSLALLDRYEKPFIYCVQGQKFLNGMCYLVSSYNPSEQKTYIYVYDPIRKEFVAQFKDMPTDIANNETEDIAFVKGTNKYNMIVGTRQKYMKLSFTD